MLDSMNEEIKKRGPRKNDIFAADGGEMPWVEPGGGRLGEREIKEKQ